MEQIKKISINETEYQIIDETALHEGDIPTNVSAFTNDAGYLTEHQSLDGLATEDYVQTQIATIPTPDVSGQIGEHNVSESAHNDIRLLIEGLTTRLNTLANSDDTTLDQMAELVEYIKDNRELIEGVTTNKVNVSDIIDNLTTNVTNKPLSAAQGVALKALIDAIDVPTKVSELTNDSGYLTSYTETDPTVPSWAKASTKPSYTKSEVGLGNVDNVKQYSASNPPPYPVTKVNNKTGTVTLSASDVGADATGTASSAVSAHNTSTTAHADIREQINQLSSEKVVLYSEQTLTEEEKSQARINLDAIKIVQQTTQPTDTNVIWIDPSDNTSDGIIEEDPKYQYIFKENITDGYFWYFDSHVTLPYKYKYDNYSTVEPITLPAGTYYLSDLMIAYTWIKVGNGAVQRIDAYVGLDSNVAASGGFVLTIQEISTIWLGYHNPQITAVTPYVVTGDAPLPVGEYFEGEEPQGLESIFDYNVFVEAYIKNCELVANELTGDDIGAAKGHYTGVKMDSHIVKQMCKAKFFPNAAVALVTTDLGSRMVTDVTFGSVHLVFSYNGCSVGVFDTKDKLRSINYFSYAITAGEELSFGFDINESTNTLTIYLPNGTTQTVTDSTISTLNGKYAIWEHFSNTSEGEFASCKITKFYCKDANGEVLEDDFKRFDGAIGVAPTGQTYRQFTSHNGNNREFK